MNSSENTFSGQPSVDQGQSPDENQVSKTSGSRSNVNFLPGYFASAFFCASASVRPDTHSSPSEGYDENIRISVNYIYEHNLHLFPLLHLL